MTVHVKELNPEEYRGKKLDIKYSTPGYYDVQIGMLSFTLKYVSFGEPREVSYSDVIGTHWLQNPVLYGAFDGDKIIGFIEMYEETQNNRLRIQNLIVHPDYRGKGIGGDLVNASKYVAAQRKNRMVVLQTQSCNINAIKRYRKSGFELVGIDTCSNSNEDIENHNVRLEYGYRIK